MDRPIYLDYNATTPVDPAVMEAMSPYLVERFGNASSSHAYGQEAQQAMDQGRSWIARLIGALPREVVCTGGGSETDNLAIKGTVFAHLDQQPHVVSTRVEHPAVLNTLRYLQKRFGVAVTLLPVDGSGLLDPESVRTALRPNTVLVTVMHGNNEVGTIQPVEQIAAITREAGVLFHIDAAQSTGKVDATVDSLGVDMMTIAGHKLYAPKGVGALYIRSGTKIDPLVHGSAQEWGLRAGTQNVAGIVALGAACEIIGAELCAEVARLRGLRDRLHALLEDGVPGLELNGHPDRRLPNTLNVSFPGVLGQAVLECTPAVAASTGSACHSGTQEPSPVLMAMGLGEERALGAIRLSVGRWTSDDDVERAGAALVAGYRAALRYGVMAG